jgi:7,8-dihydropterin-6-yl-methyl-4-(beta-D-ribofuranosyl)aminobenzene 5'-phosphate synthase
MVVKVLVENTAISDDFQTEHGLSLYIETGARRLLFDMGAGGLFLKNAKKLDVDIADIDFAVISHGHADHGGGLEVFLQENAEAPVFAHQKAFGKYYARRQDGRLNFIGLDERLMQDERVVLTGERFDIAEGIEVFSNVGRDGLFPSGNRVLLMEQDGRMTEDSFEHEQNLIVREGGKTMLFAGCAHNGITGIVRRFIEMEQRAPDYVLGGFHLYSSSAEQNESPATIAQIGEYLRRTGSVYFTGHCTGLEPYRRLKDIMGDRLEYLATGRTIEI